MAIFVGEHSATIDDKGRIVLPAAFKKAVGEMELEFVIVEKNRLGKCLDIHTEETWAENVKQFRKKLNPLDPRHDKLLQVYFQNFTRIGVAANGRINIPNEYLEFASLKKMVKFIGMYTSIRLVDASEKNQTEVSDEEYLEMLRMLKGNDED
jgi:MraZ protein